jgi:hypothetical protein
VGENGIALWGEQGGGNDDMVCDKINHQSNKKEAGLNIVFFLNNVVMVNASGRLPF